MSITYYIPPSWNNYITILQQVGYLLRFWIFLRMYHYNIQMDIPLRYWLVVWNMNFIFPYIGSVIIPFDFHIFQRGRYTTNQDTYPPYHQWEFQDPKMEVPTAKRQSRSFFYDMTIFSCVEAFPGSRAFLQNGSKLWWSQRNYVFKCFCVFSCVQLGFRYVLLLRVYVVFVAFSGGKLFLLQLLSYQWLLYVQLYLATTVKLLLNCWLLLSCCRWLLPNCCWIASELLPLGLRRTIYIRPI